MVLGDDAPWAATLGDMIERRVAPLALPAQSQIVTLSELVEGRDHRVARTSARDTSTVVPPGIDPIFSPGGEESATPMVMALGRLVPVKRYDQLIRAVAEARRRHPQLTLTIVGDGLRA